MATRSIQKVRKTISENERMRTEANDDYFRTWTEISTKIPEPSSRSARTISAIRREGKQTVHMIADRLHRTERPRLPVRHISRVKTYAPIRRRASRISSVISLVHSSRKRKLAVYVPAAAIVLCALSYFFVIRPLFAVSATATITTQSDWEAGEYYPNTLDTTTSSGDLKLKAGAGGTWDSATPGYPENIHGYWNLASPVVNYGTDLTTDGSYLYMMVGGRVADFTRYNPDTNTWKKLADAPTEFNYSGSITYYNGTIYAINGHDGTTSTDAGSELWGYNIATDTWSKLAGPPGQWGSTSAGGADIESGNNGKLYAVQGSSLEGFWIYNTVLNSWTVASSLPDPISNANTHPLVYSNVQFTDSFSTVHCTLGCIYATVGASLGTFYDYDIALDTWYTAAPSASFSTGDALALDNANHVIYAFRGANLAEFMKYTPGDPGVWDTTNPQDLQRAATWTTYGAALAYLPVTVNGVTKNYIYATIGNTASELMRYDLAANSGKGLWDSILAQGASGTNAENLAVFVPNGTDCADAAGCIIQATPSSTALRRFSMTTRIWDTLTVIPGTLGIGASMCYDGNGQIYISQGSSTSIYPFNIASGGAGAYGTTLVAPAATGAGSSITCTGDNKFYLLRGAATTNFYYSAAAGNPVADDSFNTNGLAAYTGATYGAALANNGTYVYALIGNGRGTFLRYDPSQASGSRWIELPSIPTDTSTAAQLFTSTLEYDGTGSIYAMAGKYETDFWKYTIATATWTRAADVPTRIARSMSLTKGNAAGSMYLVRGENQFGIYRFNFSTGTYPSSATWDSAPIDLNYASAFDSFSPTTTTPGTTSITFQTRTSSNKADWSTWANLSGTPGNYNVASPAGRYIQVKAVLVSDATNTPTLSSIDINYEKDSTAPSNPTISGYANNTKTTPLTSDVNSKYYYTTPYFEWTASTQAESPLAGYYVAWTTNCSFNPSSSESYFQTATSLTVNNPMTKSGAGTLWCLRMATKDASGNVSSDQTVFQYTYTGISTSSNVDWTTQANFNLGTTSNTQTTASPDDGNVILTALTNANTTGWTNDAPVAGTTGLGAGATLAYDGNDTLFMMAGNSTTSFYAYSLSSKMYTTKTSFGTIVAGTNMVYVPTGTYCLDSGGCVFAILGGATTFKRFDVSANTWTSLTHQPTIAAATGTAMAYDNTVISFTSPAARRNRTNMRSTRTTSVTHGRHRPTSTKQPASARP